MNINLYLSRLAIRLALRRPAPNRIPRGLPRAKGVNCFVVQMGGSEAGWPFQANAIHSRGVSGLWLEGDTYELPASIPNSLIRSNECQFEHYIEIYDFRYNSALGFLFSEGMLLPRLAILRNKASQLLFNKKTLVRKERTDVLRLIIEATIEDKSFSISSVGLASLIYSNRWIFHPEKDRILNYCALLLDSLAQSGDLTNNQGSYKLNAKSLGTLAQYEEEERKHRSMLSQQSALKWLTVALVGVGLLQAFVTWKN